MKSPNRYFNNYTFGPTQALYESLIIEAIRIHGLWVNYLPRTAVNMDELFGEAPYSQFADSIKIEAYPNNVDGFDGQRLMSKFQVEIRDEMKLTIAQRRFEEVRAEHLIHETGESIQQEITNIYHANQFNGILLEEGNVEGYYIPYSRPREGDLIYIPLMQRIFEIKYVQNDNIFYQGGSLPTYDIYCELLEYSHEEFNTGDSNIDRIEDLFSGDIMNSNVDTESSEELNLEDGGELIQDGVEVEDNDANAKNNLYRKEADGVVDFSELSPFVKRNTDLKW